MIAKIKIEKAVKILSNNFGLKIKTNPKNKIIKPEINFNLLTQIWLKVFLPKVIAKIKTMIAKGITNRDNI